MDVLLIVVTGLMLLATIGLLIAHDSPTPDEMGEGRVSGRKR